MAVFDNTNRADRFVGQAGVYDQVDYDGEPSDYSWVRNANGTVSVTNAAGITDTLTSIEGIWFRGSTEWQSIDELIEMTAASGGGGNGGGGGGFIDANGTITGRTGNDALVGSRGVQDIFYGDRGNDSFDGRGAEYDQVEYDGELREYTFVRNADGSVTASHATWGTDTLIDIDGLWFVREAAWYSVDDAVRLTADTPGFRLDADNVWNGTPGNDVMRAEEGGWNFYGGTGNDRYVGRDDAYDQVNFDGGLDDWTFTQNDNGVIIARHDVWGTDRLVDIDGIWLAGDGVWMSTDDPELFG